MHTGTQVIDLTKQNKQNDPVTFLALFLTIPTATLRKTMIKPLGSRNKRNDSGTPSLDWLDLTMTLNQSFCEVNCDFGHGNVHEFFNCTTKPDVDFLFIHSTQTPVTLGCIPQPNRRFRPSTFPTSPRPSQSSSSPVPRTRIIKINQSCKYSLKNLSNLKEKMFPKKKVQTTFLRMVLTKKDGTVYANKDYKLIVDGVEYPGRTDSRGLLEMALPENSTEGKLILQPDECNIGNSIEWHIDIV